MSEFQGDFNAMSDEQIDEAVEDAQAKVDENMAFIDAVATWKAAGRPRQGLVSQARFSSPKTDNTASALVCPTCHRDSVIENISGDWICDRCLCQVR